ncbi:type II CAAX prenyl endopeptidase Rce1 family protein [Streptomyces sp. NPDC059649]|uniref:CPBP family glutamic-type intramembrane protease n=1 Tax=Streptomyces sp. NPDC059649 TaxID=3346895 RepID=UPI00369D9490
MARAAETKSDTKGRGSRAAGARPAVSGWGAWGRALLGGAVMAVALGVGNALGGRLARWLELDGWARQLLPAVLVSGLAVGGVRALRSAGRRAGNGRLGAGPPAAAVRAFLGGLAVTVSCAALVLGAGTAAGWVRWSGLDPAAFAAFLTGNALVALLLEALPEETTLRGQAWAALRGRFGGVLSALGTTGVFLLVPAASTVVQAGTARAVGGDPPAVGPTPAGQDPWAYLVLLTVFGMTLVAARTVPGRAPLWAAIGTHLAFLSVNRVVFEGRERAAGWSASVAPAHAAVLELGYLVLTAAVFVGARWWSGRTRGRAARRWAARASIPTSTARSAAPSGSSA